MLTANENDKAEAWLIYDGDCPFCSRYAAFIKIRESVGVLHMLNARESHPVTAEVIEMGYDLDQGMVLKYSGRYYHGAECLHALALLSTHSGWFNRINARIFQHARLAALLYPILRFGRNSVLKILGRKKLHEA